jgi:hypothetical protein
VRHDIGQLRRMDYSLYGYAYICHAR